MSANFFEIAMGIDLGATIWRIDKFANMNDDQLYLKHLLFNKFICAYLKVWKDTNFLKDCFR